MTRIRRKLVWQRAKDSCEYCQLRQVHSVLSHEIDHIRARKHRGAHSMENTCLACAYCNGAKGSNAAGYDPETDELVLLFNPRKDDWNDHFKWNGAILVGITAIGRTTVEVLKINDPICVEHREMLIAMDVFPPE